MPESVRDLLQHTLGDSYVLERELTAGGTSRVFVAMDTTLGRKVVVKVLPPEQAVDISTDRFRREIRVAAQLQHPNIVPLHFAGTSSNGLLYYIMPYVEGDSLRSLLARSGPRPIAEVMRILRDIASALAHAHERGVVHRDIKPENVLLSGGIAVVTDFGIAKALSDSHITDPQEAVPTDAGVAVGTLKYMAPEQASGSPSVDHRADIYALGVVAYELLSGATPFHGRTPQGTLIAHMAEEPRALTSLSRDVPSEIADLVMRCLLKNPDDRPSSAAEIIGALDVIATPGGGTQIGSAAARARHGRRHLRWILPAVAAVVMAVVLSVSIGDTGQADTLVHDRVVVGRFENRTGDSSLNALAAVASDWITQGLLTSSVAEVLQAPDTGSTSASRDLRNVARRVKARLAVEGSYFRHGDSVYITADLLDVETGAVKAKVGPIAAPFSRPLDGAEQLRQRIAAALGLAVRPETDPVIPLAIRPPRYDAYREYLLGIRAAQGLDQRGGLAHLLRAVQLDPEFHMASARLAVSYQNLGDCFRSDSIVNALRSVEDQLTEWERTYSEHVGAWCRGDWEAFDRIGRRLEEIAPKSTVGKFLAARSAGFVHKRAETVEGLKKLDPAGPSLRGNMQYYDDLISSLHFLADYRGDFRENLRVARRASRQYPKRVHARMYEIDALAGMGRGEEVEAVLNEAVTMPAQPGDNETPVARVMRAVTELRAHGDTVRSRALSHRALTMLRAQPRIPGEAISEGEQWMIALYHLGRYGEARVMLDSVMKPHAGDRYAYYAWLGRLAARVGDTSTARLAMDSIEARTAPRFDKGASQFHRARIAAVLGEREETIALLRESFARGGPPSQYTRLRHFHDFEAMRGYRPFQDLLRPRE